MNDERRAELIRRLLEDTSAGRLIWFPWRDEGTFAASVGGDVIVLARGSDRRHNRDAVVGSGREWTDLVLLNSRGALVSRLTAGPGRTPFEAVPVGGAAEENLRTLYDAVSEGVDTEDAAVNRVLETLASTG